MDDAYIFVQGTLFSSLFREFDGYRREHFLCDITLVAEEGSHMCIPSHRVVLSANSEYFRVMFTTDMREKQQNTVVMRGVDAKALQALIDYCYTGQIQICPNNVRKLLQAAHLLQFHDVVKACFDFFKNNIDLLNCLDLVYLAERYSMDFLRIEALNYVRKNFAIVSQGDKFQELDAQVLADLISSSKLNVACESDVYHTVMRWVKHDLQKRLASFERLLSAVRFTQLTRKFLVDTVSKEPLIMDNPRCRSFFVNALDYHLVPERRFQFGKLPQISPREKTTQSVYAVGGENLTGCLNSVERYNVIAGEWEDLAPMIQSRKYPAAAVLDGMLYVVGGVDNSGDDMSTVERFDSVKKSWHYIAPMEKCRGSVAIAVLDGWLYSAGGSHGGSAIRSVERYDPVRDEWIQVCQMRFPRCHFGLAVHFGKIYAVGGYCGICEIEHCEMYDPISNQWKDVADLNKSRMKHGVSSHGDRIFAIGGFSSSTLLDSIEKYNLALDMWLIIKHTLDPRMGIGTATMTTDKDEQEIFILGGLDTSHIYHNSTKLINLQSIDYSMKSGLSMREPRVSCGTATY